MLEELKGIRASKKDAEKLKNFLIQKNLVARNYALQKTNDSIIFPVKREIKISEKKSLKKVVKSFFVEKSSFEFLGQQPKNLREALEGRLSKKEAKQLIRGFDVIGDIALVDIPKTLEKKQGIIADAVMRLHRNIKTVCKKTGKVTGKFRVRKVRVIAGIKKTETIHRESGCVFKVDIARAFFSPRLAGERQRIAGQIKAGETIGAFFAGIGSYPIIFAKKTGMGKAFAVELNKEAVKLLKENIRLNKVEKKVMAVQGDVKKLAKKIAGKCDRVVMPMPKGAENFLKEAITAAKNKAVIHFYQFVAKKQGVTPAIKKIDRAAKKLGFGFNVIGWRKVVGHSPEKIEIVVDFSIAKAKNFK